MVENSIGSKSVSHLEKKISLYAMCQSSSLGKLLAQLDSHSAGKGCLYIESLEGIDQKILNKIFEVGAIN